MVSANRIGASETGAKCRYLQRKSLLEYFFASAGLKDMEPRGTVNDNLEDMGHVGIPGALSDEHSCMNIALRMFGAVLCRCTY